MFVGLFKNMVLLSCGFPDKVFLLEPLVRFGSYILTNKSLKNNRPIKFNAEFNGSIVMLLQCKLPSVQMFFPQIPGLENVRHLLG